VTADPVAALEHVVALDFSDFSRSTRGADGGKQGFWCFVHGVGSKKAARAAVYLWPATNRPPRGRGVELERYVGVTARVGYGFAIRFPFPFRDASGTVASVVRAEAAQKLRRIVCSFSLCVTLGEADRIQFAARVRFRFPVGSHFHSPAGVNRLLRFGPPADQVIRLVYL